MENTELETITEKAAPEKVKPQRGHRLFPFQPSSPQVSLVQQEKAEPDITVENHEDGIVLEPVLQQPYIISYVCLLIPRFENHDIAGDMVEYLHGWMSAIAISYTWKLEWIEIQKGHLQWLLSVPVAVPPAHFFRIIRQNTSGRIFEEFPRFRQENVGKDFWAPGHMLIVGKRPHAPEMISEFVRLTRLQQGISPYQRRG
jgi:REP element-mobilizing transposase RayT